MDERRDKFLNELNLKIQKESEKKRGKGEKDRKETRVFHDMPQTSREKENFRNCASEFKGF